QGELARRQRLLHLAGNQPDLRAYTARRATDPRLEPLPHLLVVVHESGELLPVRPEFLDIFTAIGRVGRSLGMHLLLASQRLDEGRLRGLDSHLRYRICLRTFSAAESTAVLGVPDAHHLPPAPGAALLKVDAVPPAAFTAALVSADLETLVGGLAGAGRPGHPVWAPPPARALPPPPRPRPPGAPGGRAGRARPGRSTRSGSRRSPPTSPWTRCSRPSPAAGSGCRWEWSTGRSHRRRGRSDSD